MNAVSYLRVSGTGQADGDGFPRQADATQAFADTKGFTLVACFFEAFTGTRDDRPAFLAMLEYCDEHDVRTILVERMDRWARKFSTGEALAEMCRQRGITVINCATGDNLTDDESDPDAWFIGALSLLMAEWDKRKVVHRMSIAKARIRKERGKCDGRKGYADTPGFEHIVARAANYRSDGMSYARIAEVLASENVPTMYGGKWRAGVVHQMLNAAGGQT